MKETETGGKDSKHEGKWSHTWNRGHRNWRKELALIQRRVIILKCMETLSFKLKLFDPTKGRKWYWLNHIVPSFTTEGKRVRSFLTCSGPYSWNVCPRRETGKELPDVFWSVHSESLPRKRNIGTVFPDVCCLRILGVELSDPHCRNVCLSLRPGEIKRPIRHTWKYLNRSPLVKSCAWGVKSLVSVTVWFFTLHNLGTVCLCLSVCL